MCNFKSSQKDENRAQWTDSTKPFIVNRELSTAATACNIQLIVETIIASHNGHGLC